MWVCPKCLKQISDGSKICRECGAILEEVEDEHPTEEDLPEQSDQVSATEEKQGSQVQSDSLIDTPEEEEDLCVTYDDQNQQKQVEVLPWTCKKCGEHVPGTFDVCWKCGETREGLEDPEFVTERPDVGEIVQPEVVSNFEISTEPQGKFRCAIDARNCPDCDGSMREIRIIDKGGESLSHHDLEYAAPDAERGFWMKRYPVAGKITAYMCQDCGAIRLFGHSPD